MKKNSAIALCILFLFLSCETDFDINSSWKNVTVVYGLLDQSEDVQYVRINKAFLGDEDAYVMASVSDSINYHPSNLEVKIEKISASGDVLDVKVLTDTIMEKDTGDFAFDENIIYVFEDSTDDFLVQDKSYLLTIVNKELEDTTTAQTHLIHDFALMSSFNNPNYRMSFATNSGDYSSTTVEWNHSKNASFYELTMYLNYNEYKQGSTTIKQIQKTFPMVRYDNVSTMMQKITGEEFFSFIENKIDEDDMANRQVIDIDLEFSAGSYDLETYINVNKPPTGIVQERPTFTNVTNGIGLFSCKYTKWVREIPLSDNTKDAIVEKLGYLNFIP